MADDIVSSIAALSESIREKVDELKHMHAVTLMMCKVGTAFR